MRKSSATSRPRSAGSNFYEYLASVDFTLPESQIAGHLHFLESAKEVLKGLDYIIEQNEGVSFTGGGHFSSDEVAHLVAAQRAIKGAMVPAALLKKKAPRIIRMPR